MSHPLQDLFDQIPQMDCKGHCGRGHDHCCGPIGCSTIEADQLDQSDGIASPWVTLRAGEVIMDIEQLMDASGGRIDCPHLNKLSGRCNAYDSRPLICRAWGQIKALPCPWGCKPKAILDPFKLAGLMNESRRRSLPTRSQ